MLRTIIFATGDIAHPTLNYLVKNPDLELLALITQPDKPVGRHATLTPPPTAAHLRAIAPDIPILQPRKIRDQNFLQQITALAPDLILVFAYGKILPPPLLDPPPSAASTSTPHSSPATAAHHRFSPPSSPATSKPASPSCTWTRGSTPATSSSANA